MPEGAGGVGGVHQRAAERVGGEDGVEEEELAPRRNLVAVRRGQVSVDARELGAQDLARLPHLVRLDAPAVHPRVYLQVGLEAGAGGDATRARQGMRCDGQSKLLGERQPVRQEIGEDQYGGLYPGAPQLGALLDGDDGQRVRPSLERGAGDRDRAVAVGVGLHDGHEASSFRPTLEGADVVSDGAEVYPGPGPAGGADARGRAAQGVLPAGVEDVEGQDVHAGYDPAEPPLFGDGQELNLLLGHDGRGLGEGVVGADRQNIRRHDLAYVHTSALQCFLPVLLPVTQGNEATEDVEKARSFDVGVLEDEVALGDDPDQLPPLDNRGARDARLGEELDHVLDGLLRAERGPVGLHYVPYPQLPDVLLVHKIPLLIVPRRRTVRPSL